MIGWLRGTRIAHALDGELLVDVQGVGYRVNVPAPMFSTIGGPGTEVTLYVHTHVREDAIILYGFITEAERRTFEALLTAHGVGPSLALAVLSVLRPDALTRAVMENDVATLCLVPGIGRKTAARLVLDLQARLNLPERTVTMTSSPQSAARSEVRAALAELGYGPEEIRRALEAVSEHAPDRLGDGQDGEDGPADESPSVGVEALLRQALRELAVR